MKKAKTTFALFAAVTAITVGSIGVIASEFRTSADVAADLTGKTTQEVIQESTDTGKSYGTIANEAGKLQEYKEEVLKIKEEVLNQNVTDGYMTKEEADEALEAIKERQAVCDGTGLGRGAGYGRGMGAGCGNGIGGGRGRGMGMGCVIQ